MIFLGRIRVGAVPDIELKLGLSDFQLRPPGVEAGQRRGGIESPSKRRVGVPEGDRTGQ